jgi:transposase
MSYKKGFDKKQYTVMPPCLDDYVSDDHLCRVISAFTDQLDMLELGYRYAETKGTGSRPYDPRMMLNLYLYGYMNRIRSSRRLEAETIRNVEVMWLMDGLTPDDKTISNFRKDNASALRRTFRAFSLMFHELGLYGGVLVATDGTKFRANSHRKNNHSKTSVERELSRLDKKISEYMNALEQSDNEEAGEKTPTADELKEVLEKLKDRRVKFEELLSRVENEGAVSSVDPDARLMKSGGDARPIDSCYNVQTTVDSKHHLILGFEATTCADDKGNLERMSEKVKDVLGVEEFVHLADKGYYDGEDIAACEGKGITCLVAKPKPGGSKKSEDFTLDKFIYDKDTDCYTCPCQSQLGFMRMQRQDGKEYRVYENFAACRQCPRKTECTSGKLRRVIRLSCQDMLDVVFERTSENKELYRKRSEIAEHPFGTIKAVWGFKQFLCRGVEMVAAETSLAYIAYNMRRCVNTFMAENKTLVNVW